MISFRRGTLLKQEFAVLIALAAAMISACTTPNPDARRALAEQAARRAGWEMQVITAGPFEVATFVPRQSDEKLASTLV